MKKKHLFIAVCALALSTPMMSYASVENGKDLCLLNSDNCPNRTLSIVEIIAKLQNEINKGGTVYTADELRILNAKLAEYQGFMDQMQRP
ncbi:MAG TPA: hypothetical protein VJ550_15525 [Geomonas sp.]|nr:hypothetical protein [Geomonas sp.]